MLQRAASNTYSWWAASHIRTKQSKWLEQSLQDMQEKVQSVIKLIEEDGDSFAKKAEMYYKKRPELINFVEESYRAYRSLAERYDHLSKELQTANNTIANVFPEQIQLAIEEEDESNLPKAGIKKLKTASSKQSQGKKKSSEADVPKSGLNKSQGLEEIDKLQKEILALQTVKEFIKSSYQSGLEKFRGVENEIMEKQEKICKLEDEFGEGRVIEDGEACTLMAGAALQSCQQTLTQLQEKQDNYTQEAREEFKKIEDACNKLNSFRDKYLGDKATCRFNIPKQEVSKETMSSDYKLKEQDCVGSLTVSQMAEKIDELVNKVVSLETAVASQSLLIERLRKEANDLQSQVQALEDNKADDTHNLNIRVTAIEENLQTILNLNKHVVNQDSSLRTHFVEARTSLDHLSDKLSDVKPDEEVDGIDEVTNLVEAKLTEDPQKQKEDVSDKQMGITKTAKKHVTFREPMPTGKSDEKVLESTQTQIDEEKDDELNWQQMLLSGLDDKENILLNEYTTILKNYKEVTKKVSEMEMKERDTEFELALQLRELKSAVGKRDEEIHSLRLKLSLLQQGNACEDLPKDLPQRKDGDTPTMENEDDIKVIFVDQRSSKSLVEEKIRKSLGAILNENLGFWLRFSSSFNQIQKFKTTVHDLQWEISKLRDEGTQGKSEIMPIYKHMKEIQNELVVWSEQTLPLKDELESRFSSLCNIQEDITKALKVGVEIGFSSHQAAKFQGEVMNMKQENTRVLNELEAGIRRVTTLQEDVQKTVTELDQIISVSKSSIPLHSFIFGTKSKKQKRSVFSRINRSRKY